jgi:hypothetical protein
MRTRFRIVRLLPWALGLAILPIAIIALPGSPSNWADRSPTAVIDRETASSLPGPSKLTSDPATRPPGVQPAARRSARASSDDEQRRLMMYLILRSATGRYPFAILR